MKILFYIPYNQQVVYIESIAEKFAEENQIYLLTHDRWGPTHENFSKFNTISKRVSKPLVWLPLLSHFSRVIQLIRFCVTNKIDIVYSHYQEANLISCFAQFFVKARFIMTRHHSDCAFVDHNLRERIGDFFINRLSRYYVAPSSIVYKQIVDVENTNPAKVFHIDYGYNFNSFSKPDNDSVDEIKEQFQAKLILAKAARFISEKRHANLISVVNSLVADSYDIKLLLLGKGPEQKKIQNMVSELGMDDHIHFLGYRNDVQNYYAAADLLVHLSISEASNSAIKEAAIIGTPVAVCENVGDFSDYINHNENGFLLDKKDPNKQLELIIKEAYKDKSKLKVMGENLKKEVERRFDVNNVIAKYEELNESAYHGKN